MPGSESCLPEYVLSRKAKPVGRPQEALSMRFSAAGRNGSPRQGRRIMSYRYRAGNNAKKWMEGHWTEA